jgi:flagellar FliL protein
MADRDRDDADEAAPPVPPVPKKRGLRKLLIPVLVVIGVLVLGAGAYFAGRMTAPHAESVEAEADAEASAEEPVAKKGKAGKAAKAGAKGKEKSAKAVKRVPIYWALDPAFVVNYQDSQVLRFLQVGVQVMAYDTETIELLKANEPLVRNALLMLFSDQQYETLITRAGKDKLREQALAELRKIVAEQSGKSGSESASPESVYFTGFVMQ